MRHAPFSPPIPVPKRRLTPQGHRAERDHRGGHGQGAGMIHPMMATMLRIHHDGCRRRAGLPQEAPSRERGEELQPHFG